MRRRWNARDPRMHYTGDNFETYRTRRNDSVGRAFGDFIRRLKETKEGDSNLLDQSMVLLWSHMHSGGHDNRNLPIILAGGGFRHGQHLAFDRDNNYPLANLHVTMLRRLGLEVDSFASSTGPMSGLEVAAG